MNCFDNWKIRFLNIDGGDMPDDKYFAIKGCTSISRLKLLHPLHGGSPQKYLEGCNFGFNPSLLVGTLTHLEILQPDDLLFLIMRANLLENLDILLTKWQKIVRMA